MENPYILPEQTPCYVDGEFIYTDQYVSNTNPVNGQNLGQLCEANQALIEQAVTAARYAQNHTWGKMTSQQRCQLLHQVADKIAENEQAFIQAEMADTGKSLQQLTQIDIPRGTANFRIFADMVKSYAGESFITEQTNGDKALNYTIHKPLGVVAIISPWNLPLLLATWKIAPALACGNSVIVKPSEETSSTMYLLAQIMDEVGIPKGAFNLLLGRGEVVGDPLTRHPGIDAITFTGATKTGSQIMKNAAANVKPVSFELGGKNSAIVFADADLEKALNGVTRSSFTNCGQVCLCTEKVYVHRSIFDAFVEGLKQRAESLTIGYPTDPDVFMGPLVSKQHRDKVLSYFQLASQEGAQFITGGSIPVFNDDRDNGFFIQPTIITGLDDDARTNQEEIFGPICHLSVFDDEDEVIARVNNTRYGLAASIWTDNLTRAHRTAAQIDVGMVWVNTWFLRDLRTPFGGCKLSGIGREGGQHSLSFYSQTSNICIQIDN
ncbi:2-hydroxymuconic semialdehyde dehydrogenase [Thalassotalea ponticola]|uniref:2-hydroxymuconic semialdehyde dehydrogenase n=1 Tax=Thalassotalea ponticola TaxID=1523392 RepID=UPI0025B56121|nr:2-hydroxymuconic semialdehyde dehydrogenase [Thalassotalea ponticola]MDN3653338.1 2-hydroxymuconic semialdehyde dehydrogenase [Thalassotalea ponticola]